MLLHNIHRERKFPLTITNLAELFLEIFEHPSYMHNKCKGHFSLLINQQSSFLKQIGESRLHFIHMFQNSKSLCFIFIILVEQELLLQ